MSVLDGMITKKVVSYDYKDFVEQCDKSIKEGYVLVKAKQKILWPYFWNVEYKAKFKKDFIYDTETGEHVILPKDIQL